MSISRSIRTLGTKKPRHKLMAQNAAPAADGTALLGTGAAAKAAKALKDRQRRLQEQIDAATGGSST